MSIFQGYARFRMPRFSKQIGSLTYDTLKYTIKIFAGKA